MCEGIPLFVDKYQYTSPHKTWTYPALRDDHDFAGNLVGNDLGAERPVLLFRQVRQCVEAFVLELREPTASENPLMLFFSLSVDLGTSIL